jgi:hypothetical protein
MGSCIRTAARIVYRRQPDAGMFDWCWRNGCRRRSGRPLALLEFGMCRPPLATASGMAMAEKVFEENFPNIQVLREFTHRSVCVLSWAPRASRTQALERHFCRRKYRCKLPPVPEQLRMPGRDGIVGDARTVRSASSRRKGSRRVSRASEAWSKMMQCQSPMSARQVEMSTSGASKILTRG